MFRKIDFNIPTKTGDELNYVQEVLTNEKYSGDGFFNKKCEYQLTNYSRAKYAKLTPSCTASLEMAMLVCNIKHGDEVIMPSYTFSSTANAVLLVGGIPVFIDCKTNDMNIDENLIEAAITPKTKMIMPMHYAGAPCEMDKMIEIAERHNLFVVSDAAQAIGSRYKQKHIETIGDISTLSFHETKNISCGEGGAIIINDEKLFDRADIIREKGTNRKQFFDGLVDKYTWYEVGSSYLVNEFTAAVLSSQLNKLNEIIQSRIESWNFYHEQLAELENKEWLTRPKYSSHIQNNGHIYFVILPPGKSRKAIQDKLAEKGVYAIFHYIPLHSAPAGKKYCRIGSTMNVTDDYSERLLRLPIYDGIKKTDQIYIIEQISEVLSKM